MRRISAVLLAVLAVTVGLPSAGASPAAAASTGPKVVIVVGPVGSETAHYKRDADQVAEEAARYTSNVVKVYTPNATWARVKAAMQGASVFVYLGHGNGWPSPYPPFQETTKNGLGLDPSTGADGTRHVYYGADYIRANIRFAPNAVVLFYHLCYASGNTEGYAKGIPEGPLSSSRERVDGYAAGFLDAGARAVFATGHPHHPVVYQVRQLFTTRKSMAQIFRDDPDWNGNLKGPYASVRSPGLQYQMDPDAPDGGFWRSLAGDLSMSAAAVTATSWKPTDGVPAAFTVPGAAEVVDPVGAPLFADAAAAADVTGAPVATLAPGTRLRLLAPATPMADGSAVFEAALLDGTARGFVRAGGLAPRDSAATTVWYQNHSTGVLSPNGDGVDDGFAVSVRLSEPIDVTFRARDAAGTVVKTIRATGDLVRVAWGLQSGGVIVPDGDYTWTLTGQDSWGNTGISLGGRVSVDATAPVTTHTLEAAAGNEGWLRSAPVVTLRAVDNKAGVASTRLVHGGDAIAYEAPVTIRGDGPHEVRYRSTDRVANREVARELAFKVDATKPAVTVALDGEGGDTPGMFRGPVVAGISVSDPTSGLASVSASLDGTPVTVTEPVAIAGEGAHLLAVTAADIAGNRGTTRTTVVIDSVAPVLSSGAAGDTAPRPTVTPNGDGVTESLRIPFQVDEPSTVTATVADPAGTVLRRVSAAGDGAGVLAWDGRTGAGAAVPDGAYAATLVARDGAGNESEPVTLGVDVFGALASVARTPASFYPQDGDRLARSTTVSFRLLAPTETAVAVVDAAGRPVRTLQPAAALPAGARSFAWDGRRDDGTWAPRGAYRFVVSATNGTQRASRSVAVRADAFVARTSVTRAVRGRTFTLTATSVERLSRAPRVVVRQPGRAAWTVTMTRVSGRTWRAAITPRRGETGTLVLVIRGTDERGGTNRSRVTLPLR